LLIAFNMLMLTLFALLIILCYFEDVM